MVTVKIISNPYKKEVRFERLSDDASEWIPIDLANNPNSKLLREKETRGFFPFYVKDIVQEIVEEYAVPEEPVTLVFEGSADEYEELEAVCASGQFEAEIITKRSVIGLANARDILPEVKALFQKMSSLINQSVSQEKVQHDLVRFSDASSDVVPICVLGNYSTGKSTFINALIGSELLPSGAEPVTAKVYKISRSKYADRASVKCQYLGEDISVIFTKSETYINEGLADNTLSLDLKKAFEPMSGDPLIARANKALSIINDMENQTEAVVISDLIEVEVPFSHGVLASSLHPFVIFDTPGSNSASNIKHLNVLKDAMANMTNGLPIFLSTPDALDSTDNESLYQIIRSMEELDSRFTMIVVNKADSSGIQRRGSTEEEQQRILSQAVPKNLYSGGLFYVSSILGLGSKTGGVFNDYDYEDIYEAQIPRYRDPGNRHYRSLYSLNIMPSQIKQRSDMLAAEQSDLVYANSGLFSVETEIETFAGKYAAYNKCFQSERFLRKVISITEEEIEKRKQSKEGIKHSINDTLEKDKSSLLGRLNSAAAKEKERYGNQYPDYMAEYIAETKDTFSLDQLKKQEAGFVAAHREELAAERHEKAVQEAVGLAGENLRSNFGQVFNNRRLNLDAVRTAAQGFVSDVGTVIDKTKTSLDTRREVDKAVADNLMGYVAERFKEKLAEYCSLLDEESKAYWTRSAESIRTLLATIVSGEEVLTDDRRSELEQIIINYKPISFDDKASVMEFNKEDFEHKIQLGNVILWQSDHLNTGKIAEEYNRKMDNTVAAVYKSIGDSHRESAQSWAENLLGEITLNIIKYSPSLSKHQQQIETLTAEIRELSSHQQQLRAYSDELSSMMNWRVV